MGSLVYPAPFPTPTVHSRKGEIFVFFSFLFFQPLYTFGHHFYLCHQFIPLVFLLSLCGCFNHVFKQGCKKFVGLTHHSALENVLNCSSSLVFCPLQKQSNSVLFVIPWDGHVYMISLNPNHKSVTLSPHSYLNVNRLSLNFNNFSIGNLFDIHIGHPLLFSYQRKHISKAKLNLML